MTIEASTKVSSEQPTSFILPDLVSHCNFKLTYHVNGDEIAQQSVDWLDTNCPDLNAKQRRALRGLQAGELTAFCYHNAAPERLRVVSDFMNYLFHLDNISDGMMTRETDVLSDVVMNALWYTDKYMPTALPGKEQPADELNPGKLARDFWGRCIPKCGPGAQGRFKETLELFFEAVNIQARARDEGIIPDLESYIDVRRDTSGCKPCWALIEYALDIDLPDFVIEHPIIEALNQGTNDLVTWSNDIFSYNVEQSRGDTHNMIVILMVYHGHTLQSAIDYVGDLCAQTIDTFSANKKKLPSWGPEIDDMVERYVQGLQDWIVGSLHWSFQTHRYFGTKGQEVKKHRFVKLLPLEVQPTPEPEPVKVAEVRQTDSCKSMHSFDAHNALIVV
ncbi:isoprenoid synthase domain-containing protein [Crassisporium funariophilum]|nr:isoprenoid synthase domain-containing protein [Crassisporium funariophilum]